MALPQPPLQSNNADVTGKFTSVWQNWITRVQALLNALSNSGSTAGRPTQNLYVGQPYFDTTLNQVIWWNGSAWIKDAPATTGTSILSGDGNGGFTPVTIGTGLFYVGHTLSSTGGTLTTLSVATANGFAGTVATPSTTPVITLETTISGLLKGNGTAINAAVSGVDYSPATSGTSILYGNGSGGFSNVTIGSGVSFVGGTLSATGSGGTVTSVSVATANGFAGTSSGGTTPALTLSTTITGILQGNGTAISAASTTGTGAVVLASSPTVSGDWGSFNSLLFNTSASVPSPVAGQLWWDGFGTLNLQMDSHVTAQLGETSYFYAKASSAVTVGQLCMFTGVVGASSAITVAPATGITNGQYIVGIAAESIATNSFGYIQNFGTLKGFDTTGSSVGETWVDGDILYYNSAYAGGLTKVYPASGPIVTIAAVVNAGSGGSGSVIIRPAVTQRITTSSPLSITQAASGTSLSISQASATTSGYLSSTDWNTFNNKQPAGTYVTSISVASSNGLAGTSSGGATPTLTLSTSITGILKGNGTAISAAVSGTDYAPATSGTSILYGNGAGGFSNVTIGSGVSFVGGTLSATGSGGTVTSVTGTSPVVSSGGTTPAISLASGYGDTQNPYTSKTANYVLASPSGSSGVPVFRALTSSDIPSLSYVSSVSGSAPVVSSGGLTPTISMAAATGSVNGYLTSTDWTTFNGKQAALVSGTNIKTVGGVSLLGSGDVGTIGTGYGGTGTSTTFTTGSIVFAGASGVYSQDNSNLFWDATNHRLGVGHNIPLTLIYANNGQIVSTAGTLFSPTKFDSQGIAWNTETSLPSYILNGQATDRPEISWYRGSRTYPELTIRQHTSADTGGEIYAGPGTAAPTKVAEIKSTGMILTTPTFSGLATANGGIKLAGTAALGTTNSQTFSFESPVTRYYIGDGTGYSWAFSKRTASTTTDVVTITDSGATSISSSLTVSGFTNTSVAVSSGFNIKTTNSYSDNLAHTISINLNNAYNVLYIYSTAGKTTIPIFSNGGAGVAYGYTYLSPATGTWTYSTSSPVITWTQAGTGGNTYSLTISSANGSITIQATAGSLAYTVYQQTFGN